MIDRLAWWLLLATLVTLPFEARLPMASVGPLVITTLEVIWALALVLWLAAAVVNRRPPRVPMVVAAALGVLLVGGLASALVADGFNEEAVTFVGRSFAAWLLFIAVADTCSRRPSAHVGAAIVCGATLSGAFGLVMVFAPEEINRAFGVPLFPIFDARRLVGTLEYPNSAAMVYEAAVLLALGLIPVWRGVAARVATVGGAATLLAAMVMTLSRGAIVGVAAGLGTILLLALGSGRRRLALAAVACGAVVVLGAVAIQFSLLPAERVTSDATRGLFGATYDAPAAVRAEDGRAIVRVGVTNSGTLPWTVDGERGYRLGYRWLSPDGSEILYDGEEDVALGLLPSGQSTTVEMSIAVPDDAAGRLLAWDVVRADGQWFSGVGVPVVATEVVTGGGEAPSGNGREIVLYPDLVLAPTREELWRASVAMTAERPLLGVGPGTFRLRYGPYLGLDNWDDRNHANNLYLELGATTGLVGLGAFLVLVGAVLVPLFRGLLRNAPARAAPRAAPDEGQWLWSAAVGAAVVCFLAHGLLDYFFGFNPTSGLFAAILGLALAAGRERT